MIDALARQVADRIGADVLGGPNLLTAADIATIRDELAKTPACMATLDELWPVLTPNDRRRPVRRPDRLEIGRHRS